MKFRADLNLTKPKHGPQNWGRFKVISLKWLKLTTYTYKESLGYRLWVYSKWGAISFDYYKYCSFDHFNIVDNVTVHSPPVKVFINSILRFIQPKIKRKWVIYSNVVKNDGRECCLGYGFGRITHIQK